MHMLQTWIKINKSSYNVSAYYEMLSNANIMNEKYKFMILKAKFRDRLGSNVHEFVYLM